MLPEAFNRLRTLSYEFEVLILSQKFPNKLWVGGYDDHEYILKKGVPISRKGGWVDPTWDKVLNSTIFLEGIPKSKIL